MKLAKLIKVSKQHAEQMYQVVKENNQREYKKWISKQKVRTKEVK